MEKRKTQVITGEVRNNLVSKALLVPDPFQKLCFEGRDGWQQHELHLIVQRFCRDCGKHCFLQVQTSCEIYNSEYSTRIDFFQAK